MLWVLPTWDTILLRQDVMLRQKGLSSRALFSSLAMGPLWETLLNLFPQTLSKQRIGKRWYLFIKLEVSSDRLPR